MKNIVKLLNKSRLFCLFIGLCLVIISIGISWVIAKSDKFIFDNGQTKIELSTQAGN